MALAILIHALVFLAFWLTNLPYQESLNDFLSGVTGLRCQSLLKVEEIPSAIPTPLFSHFRLR